MELVFTDKVEGKAIGRWPEWNRKRKCFGLLVVYTGKRIFKGKPVNMISANAACNDCECRLRAELPSATVRAIRLLSDAETNPKPWNSRLAPQ